VSSVEDSGDINLKISLWFKEIDVSENGRRLFFEGECRTFFSRIDLGMFW
jgi:hypothetical protein